MYIYCHNITWDSLNLDQAMNWVGLLTSYIRPFPVEQKEGLNYTLKLPTSMKVHSTFHVERLKKYHRPDEGFPGRPVPDRPDPVLVDGDEHYYLTETIVSHKMKRKALKFLVHWKGYPVEEWTWEPLNYMKECDAFQEYLLKHPELEGQIQKKGSVMVNHQHSPETEGCWKLWV